MAVVRACVAMLPQLEAEESLLAARRASIGAGLLDEKVTKEILAAWQTDANAHTTETPTPPKPERTAETMRAAGLRVFGASA